MHTHAKSCLEGPVSRTREWWRQLEAYDDPSTSDEKEPMFRAGLVEQIRREIAAGTYDTPEKMEIAFDRLLKRLEAEEA
jgi:hypothetical protein